jgi:hypothetical protein
MHDFKARLLGMTATFAFFGLVFFPAWMKSL